MEHKDKRKTGKISYIFTRETLGMTLMLFSAIVFVMLLTRGLVFAGVGEAICTFMYGSFGYLSVFLVALLAYFGEWLVFEKKLSLKRSYVLVAVGAIFSLFLLFHSVVTRDFSMESYGEYLSQCYNNAAEGWAGYTLGGAVGGLIVFPIAKLMTFIGAYVVFSLLFLLCAYAGFILFKRNYVSSSQLPVAKKPEEEHEEVYHTESQRAADHLYSVGEEQEIVSNRQMEAAAAAAEPVTPTAVPQPQAEQPQPEDKFSQKNLGRKILFENGEFAAESYRRNMLYSGESYFNNPENSIASPQDYLSSFSDPKKAAEAQNSYTKSYEKAVSEEQPAEHPLSYSYGERPVENLPDDYPAAYPEPAPEEFEEQPAETPAPEPEEPTFVESEEIIPPVREVREPVSEEPAPTPEPEPEPPAREVRERPEESKGILSSLFGTDSPREAGRGDRAAREESNDSELFDGDFDSVFDVNQRGTRGSSFTEDPENRTSRDRLGRTPETPRDETPQPSEPVPQQPAPRERDGSSLFGRPEGRTPLPPRRPEPPVEEPKPEPPKHVWKKYVRPTLDLLDEYPENNNVNTGEIEDSKRAIVDTLEKFKISSEVANVTIGPAITRYDVIIADRTNIKRSLNYRDEIALALMKNNVNAYMNYPKGAISIEVPNSRRSVVGLKTMLASSKFINSKPNSLTFGLGKNIEGEVVCPDITKMPHLLVAGTTGSGKSICLSALLISLLYKYGPEDLRLILVDPKQAEFVSYNKLPHLMINEILYEIDKVIKALNWAINEMERRYALFKEMTENGKATKDLDEYNAHLEEGEEKLPKIVIVLDEFGDLMIQAKKDIEGRIVRLVQKARACGIHLILATQRPSVNCITGLIKSNLPTRIGFKVGSFDDSRTIFDIGGAEKLLGKGDMYYRSADNPELTRIQGCFVSSNEVQKVTDFIKANNETYFDQSVTDFINKVEEPEPSPTAVGDMPEDGDTKMDDTFLKALKYCITSNQASVSMIQRRFPVGYIKACKIIDWMEKMNYITQSEGSKPRKILLTAEEFNEKYGDVDD